MRRTLAIAMAVLAILTLVGAIALGRDQAEPDDQVVRQPTSCQPGPAVPAPTIDLGVQAADGTTLLSRRKVARLVALAQRAGATVISTSASWRYLQRTADTPTSDLAFEGVDRVVDAARAAGLQVRLQLIGMPAWAVSDQTRPWSDNRPPLTPDELARWTDFVTAVAQHEAGRVDYLEVWNEPNGTPYWPTGPDPAAFADLLAATYAPVKAVAPDMQVISGGLVDNDLGYLEALYTALDAMRLPHRPFDLVGVHPFTGDASPSTVDPSRTYERTFGLVDADFTGYEALHDVMARHDDDSDLYITSFGYGARANRGQPAVPDEVRAGYVREALLAVTCAPYVRAISWYYLHPTPYDPPSWTLVDARLRPNDTYRAFVDWTREVASSGAPQVSPIPPPAASPGG